MKYFYCLALCWCTVLYWLYAVCIIWCLSIYSYFYVYNNGWFHIKSTKILDNLDLHISDFFHFLYNIRTCKEDKNANVRCIWFWFIEILASKTKQKIDFDLISNFFKAITWKLFDLQNWNLVLFSSVFNDFQYSHDYR